MNCENPIRIVNRSKSFLFGVDNTTVLVPCNECDACRNAMQKEWYLRAYAQYKATQMSGGKTIFVTLTYDNKTIPMYDTQNHSLCHGNRPQSHFIPVFDHSDTDNFFEALRQNLKRAGYYTIKDGKKTVPLKYLIASEYGQDDKYTRRPHYHALIYFPNYGLSVKQIKKFIAKSWTLGYPMYSKESKGGAEVNSSKAISYVSKYCTKDIGYFAQPKVQAYLGECRQHKHPNYQKIKAYLPKHHQSKGFGSYLANWVVNHIDPFYFFERGVGAEFADPSQTYRINLPRYIVNKLTKRTLEDGRTELTEFGVKVQERLYDTRIKDSAANLQKKCSNFYLSQAITDADAETVCPWTGLKTTTDLADYIRVLMDGRDFETLAIYKKVWQDVPAFSEEDLLDANTFLSEDFVNKSKAVFFARQDEKNKRHEYEYQEEAFLSDKDALREATTLLYNRLPMFSDFDKILDIIANIDRVQTIRRTKAYMEKKAQIQKMQDLYNYGAIAQ